jgi:hypothetical protein
LSDDAVIALFFIVFVLAGVAWAISPSPNQSGDQWEGKDRDHW